MGRRRGRGFRASVLALTAIGMSHALASGQVYVTHLASSGVAPPPANDVFADALGVFGPQPADIFFSSADRPADGINLGNRRSHDNNGAQAGGGITRLGLASGDVIDALHIQQNIFAGNTMLSPHFLFSVRRGSTGLPGTAVAGDSPTNGADVFEARVGGLFATIGTNAKAIDEIEMGFAPNDEMNALDHQATAPAATNTARIYFSLAAGSPTLASIPDPFGGGSPTATPGDVLTTVPGSGTITIAIQHEALGLDRDDDLDALTFLTGIDRNNDGDWDDIIVDGDIDNDDIPPIVYFSVTRASDGMPGNAIEAQFLAGEVQGDIFGVVVGAVFGVGAPGPAFPPPAAPALTNVFLASDEADIGLDPDDNLDALDILTFDDPDDVPPDDGGGDYWPGPRGGTKSPTPPFGPPGPPGSATCHGLVSGKFSFGNGCYKTFCFRFSIVDKATTKVLASVVIRGSVIVPGCNARSARVMNNALAAIFASIPLPGGNRATVSRTRKGGVRVTIPKGTMASPTTWLVFNGWTNGFLGCVWEHWDFGGNGIRRGFFELPNNLGHFRLRSRIKILGDNAPIDPEIFPLQLGGQMILRLPTDPEDVMGLDDSLPQDPVPPPFDPNWFDVFVPIDPNETFNSMQAKLLQAIPQHTNGFYQGIPTPLGVDVIHFDQNTGDEVPFWAAQMTNSSTMQIAMEYEAFADCNNNGLDDEFDIGLGLSRDDNNDGVPDECAPVCPADLTTSVDPNNPGFGVPDGVVDANDFFFYLLLFAANDPAADLTTSIDPNNPGFGVPDGVVDANDFFFYLILFEQGCN